MAERKRASLSSFAVTAMEAVMHDLQQSENTSFSDICMYDFVRSKAIRSMVVALVKARLVNELTAEGRVRAGVTVQRMAALEALATRAHLIAVARRVRPSAAYKSKLPDSDAVYGHGVPYTDAFELWHPSELGYAPAAYTG